MKYYGFLFLLFFISCSKSAQQMPLSAEKMTKILTDIHLAESALQGLSLVAKDSMAQLYYQQVFEIHGVKQVDFDSSMALLQKNPTQMKIIYDQILIELEKEKEPTPPSILPDKK